MFVAVADDDDDELQTDEEGNPICIVCNEKLTNEKEWAEHVEFERSNLKQNVSGLKEQKSAFDRNVNSSLLADQNRRKRESELNRIRLNQQKRLELKNTIISDAQTTTGRPSNSTSPFSSPSAGSLIKKEDAPLIGNTNYCKFCERHYEYLIISNSFEEPRCQDCFAKLRAQTSALPLTITSASLDTTDSLCDENAETSSPQSPLSLVVDAKRSRFN
ncbi:unnamed protein product [Enterobius vermicularis]|uniref:Uncharacterized protein n=1 Tax=Enterobius vermicularis TaxID=51028 RepID=A0A0N4VMT0_ENTVE|nr:unnamed protein product [Enterobius vermicularis]